MSNRQVEIRRLQKELVKALETGGDKVPILKKMADVRAASAMEDDQAEAQKIADARQALRNKAEAVKANVERQATAIDQFLAYRDKTLPQLEALIEPVQELARMGRASWEDKQGEPGECYIYPDPSPFQGAIRGIPKELLPDDFKCPTLEMTIPSERSFGKAKEALYYFEACIGILSNFRKGFMTPSTAATDDSLLLDNEPENETGNCIVCSHAEVKTIDNLLRQGRHLRDIESEFSVSRSSLSRHKGKCLKPGVIKVERESPTESSNSTFFKR